MRYRFCVFMENLVRPNGRRVVGLAAVLLSIVMAVVVGLGWPGGTAYAAPPQQEPTPTTLLAFKWYDADGDGSYDSDEKPIGDWQLCRADNDCKKTDTNGFAVWTGLPPVDSYIISETLPAGWATSTPLTQTGYAYAGALSGTPGPTYASIALNDDKNTVIDVA
jgi:hypothetical protein